VKEISYNIG